MIKKYFTFSILFCLSVFVSAQSIEDKLLNRFSKYVNIYTQSEEDVDKVPSTDCQFDLAFADSIKAQKGSYTIVTGVSATPIMNELVAKAKNDGGSDIHLICGLPPKYRVDGELRDMTDEPLTKEDCVD